VQASLRKVLIDSHVAAITIVVLIFYSAVFFTKLAFAMSEPALEVVFYIATAVAIRGIPSAPVTRYYITDYLLPATLPNLLFALIALAGAWLLSSWVYGTGPLRTLSNYRNKLSRKTNA
jgi:hypothetical protein